MKTRIDGRIISGQGIRPTVIKPTTELVLFGATNIRGRPFKLLTEKEPQVILAPRGKHSEKPEKVRESIKRLYGKKKCIELFARRRVYGWDAWGDEVESDIDL